MTAPTTVSAALTWEDLLSLEPRLAFLQVEAMAETNHDKPDYCANAVWGGYQGHLGLKPRLVRLVGWHAESQDPALRSSAAYDIAYHQVYDALPGCRKCACL